MRCWGTRKFIFKSDNEPAILALKQAVKAERPEDIIMEESLVGESASHGEIELKTKGCKIVKYRKYKPWFSHKRKQKDENIIFGHWASLMGKVKEKNVYALDTGCVWGGYLSAMRLEDRKLYHISSKEKNIYNFL